MLLHLEMIFESTNTASKEDLFKACASPIAIRESDKFPSCRYLKVTMNVRKT